MSEYEKMREDGFYQANHDKDIYKKDGKRDLMAHPDDPNYVRIIGSGHNYERYDSDKHNSDR